MRCKFRDCELEALFVVSAPLPGGKEAHFCREHGDAAGGIFEALDMSLEVVEYVEVDDAS